MQQVHFCGTLLWHSKGMVRGSQRQGLFGMITSSGAADTLTPRKEVRVTSKGAKSRWALMMLVDCGARPSALFCFLTFSSGEGAGGRLCSMYCPRPEAI